MSAAPAQQISFLPKRVPEDVIDEAKQGQRVIASFCLFSGGNDSTVLAHRCQDDYEALVHVDTGTAVPGVKDFCAEFAEWLGKPLVIYEAGDAYRRMVLGSPSSNGIGFPGPAQHSTCYRQLKKAQIEALVRDTKFGWEAGRHDRVLLLSGIRRAESEKRKGRLANHRQGSQLWCCPLIDWTSRDMWDYRDQHMDDAPTSDVAALLHKSGECNCGAFATPGDRETLRALWPEWFDATIGSIEKEAEEAGLASSTWGSWESAFSAADDEPMCSDCQLRIEESP